MTHRDDRLIDRSEMAVLLAYGVCHYTLAAAGSVLEVGSSQAPWFWPAAGLLPAALMLCRPRLRPALLLLAALAERAAAVSAGGAFFEVAGLLHTGANLAEALLGAAVVEALLPSPWYRRTSIEIMACICVAALIVPLVGTVSHAAMFVTEPAPRDHILTTIAAWWTADVLGVLIVSPLVGGLLLWRIVPSSVQRQHWVVAALSLGVWLAVSYAMMTSPGTLAAPTMELVVLAAASLALITLAAITLPPVLVAALFLIMTLGLNLSTRLPGTLLAQIFDAPDGPHAAARTVLLAGAMCSYLVSLVRFERRNAATLADHRHSPHRVVAQLAANLAHCDPVEADDAIVEALEIVGKTCGADRCVIFMLDSESKTFSQAYRWCRDGVEDMQPFLQQRPMAGVSELVARIDNSGSVFMLAEDVPDHSDLAAYLTRAGAWAVAYAPLRNEGGVRGVIGLTWQHATRRWGIDSSVVLQSAAQVIERTLGRTHRATADVAYREKLRALTARLDDIDVQVRRDTAADLHDGAAQSLAVARLRLAQLRAQMLKGSEPSPSEIQSVEEMVVAALSEIRGVVRRMVPSALYDFGLAHALRAFVTESSTSPDTTLTLSVHEDVDPLPPELSDTLYRAGCELVTNALKHAGAARINVTLGKTADGLVMTVADDGRGFDPKRGDTRFADGTGLGLFSLRERLARFGGAIDIRSDRDGTRAIVSAPLPDPAPHDSPLDEIQSRLG
ncbi:MAG: ATP-binding protein [Pseudomonadota bacterium]